MPDGCWRVPTCQHVR